MDTKHNTHFFWKSGNARGQKIRRRSTGPNKQEIRKLHSHIGRKDYLQETEEVYDKFLEQMGKYVAHICDQARIEPSNFIKIGKLLLYWSRDATQYRFLERTAFTTFRFSIIYKSRERAIKVYKANGIVWSETFDVNPPTVDQDDQQTTVSSNSQSSGTV